VIATVPPAPGEWADKGVTAGSTVTYRLSSHTGSGRLSDPSDDLTVVVPTTAFATQYWLGGDPADSRNALYIPQWGPGTTTWIDASPDRAHLAITTMGTRSGDPGRIYITDTRGDHPRTLAALPYGDGASFHRSTYSPDGERLAVTSQYGASDIVMIVDVASGLPIRTLVPQGTPYGWSPDGTSVLMGPGLTRYGDRVQGLRWVRVTDDYETPVVAAAAFTSDVGNGRSPSAAVARDGSVAWISSTAGADRILRAAPGASVGTVLWAPAGCVLGDLAFAPTGAQLSVSVGGVTCAAGRRGTVKLDVPTSGTATNIHPFVWFAVAGAWVVAANATPSVVVTVPVVTGSRATVTTAVADPDHALAGLSTTCRIDGTALVPCGRSWSTPTLVSGRHTVAVTVTDPAGATSTQSATWVVDSAAPTATLTALPPVLTGPTLSVSWAGVDAGGAGVASFDTRVRTAALGAGLGGYVSPASWQGRTTGSLSTSVPAGSTACFSVRARDRAGNVGGYSPERCTSSVLDDRSLRSTGTRGTGAGYLYGTWTTARGSAQQLVSATVVTRQIGLYVTGCPTCGSVDVYIGATRVGRLSTTSSTTVLRRVLWLPAFAARSGVLTLRPVTSAPVIIDGVAILK
ncbi:MAG: hypothetical protein M3Y71_04650, partial [Actinomycetota bacterium]|nr:hypothetical protein [Actinomycetota bacterium]